MIPLGAGQMAIGIGRRQFVSALGCAAVAKPLAARAQKDGRTRHVGILMRANDDPEVKEFLEAFHQGLQKLGWTDGTNLRIDVRFAADASEFEPLAKDLVSLQPDVILAQTNRLSPRCCARLSQSQLFSLPASRIRSDRVSCKAWPDLAVMLRAFCFTRRASSANG
jgi:hypothetical protein